MPESTAIRTVLVTGASSGIGRAVALRFCREGYAVVAAARSGERLEQLHQASLSLPGQLLPATVDLSLPEAGSELVATAVRLAGPLGAVVHCAAVAPRAPFAEVTTAQFDATVDLNLRGSFFLLQAAFRQLSGQGRGGVLVNISSLAAIDPFTGFSVYGSSKAWLDLLTRAIADEGKPLGIRAFSIRPGAVETGMLRGLFPDFPAEQTVSPEAIADVAWSLTRDEWRYSSGQAINVTLN